MSPAKTPEKIVKPDHLERRNKRVNHHAGPSHERWLVSYADFITLLFAFFMMLYAVSSLNEGKYRVLSNTLSEAFSPEKKKVVEAGPGAGDEQEAIRRQNDFFFGQKGAGQTDAAQQAALSQFADAISAKFQPLIAGGQIGIQRKKDWIAIELKSALLFDSGEGFPRDEAKPVLADLAKILSTADNPLRVEGYTDNVPIRNNYYPSNWDLSAARAASIVRTLEELGIKPARMVAVGYGEEAPLYPNDTPENQAKNRRVVIVVGPASGWH